MTFARRYIALRNKRLGLVGQGQDPILEIAGKESKCLAACFQGWSRTEHLSIQDFSR